MTEEELAACLGLAQTPEGLALRDEAIRLAPRNGATITGAFQAAIIRYHNYCQAAADSLSDRDDTRIGAMLVQAAMWRAICAFNPAFADAWRENLEGALAYVGNVAAQLPPDTAPAIHRLLDQMPDTTS